MASEKKKRRKLAQELEEARAEHDDLLQKVDKARAKLEKRSAKLMAIEQQIADLEKRYYEPDAERMGQADAAIDAARPARLIYNPSAGSGSDPNQELPEIVRLLRGHGIAADIDVKTSGQSARDIAKEAAANGEQLVIAAGGDDTVEEASRELVGSKTALAVIPTGTNNNLARALGIPLHFDPACALIGMGITRQLDVGVVDNGEGSEEYFLETAGAGFGAADQEEKQDSLPHSLRRFDIQPASIEIETDTGEIEHAVGGAISVSNAPLMGKNLLLTPDAKMDDGLLDVRVYAGMTEQEVLDFLNRTTDQPDPRVKSYRARTVRIESPTGAPGDTTSGPRRLEIRVLPQALAMVVGNGEALSLPVEAAPEDGESASKEVGSNGKTNKGSNPILGLFRKDPGTQS